MDISNNNNNSNSNSNNNDDDDDNNNNSGETSKNNARNKLPLEELLEMHVKKQHLEMRWIVRFCVMWSHKKEAPMGSQ